MAFYADQMFYSRSYETLPALSTCSITGTGTAVTGVIGPASSLPTFFRNTSINKAQLFITTSNAGNPIWNFYSGTSTSPAVTFNLGTAAANTVIQGTVNTAFSTFTAGASVTGTATGTATSAGASAGAGQVTFEFQEAYSSSD